MQITCNLNSPWLLVGESKKAFMEELVIKTGFEQRVDRLGAAEMNNRKTQNLE